MVWWQGWCGGRDGVVAGMVWRCEPLKIIFTVAIKGEFVKYMEAFGPYLKMTLKNFSEHQVRRKCKEGGVPCHPAHQISSQRYA